MKSTHCSLAAFTLATVVFPFSAPAQSPDATRVVWQIGVADGRSDDLASVTAASDSDDGFFVVGLSDPKRDWPCVHRGAKAATQHTFRVVFGLGAAPAAGKCRLSVRVVNAAVRFPPRLRVEVNGHVTEVEGPPGTVRSPVPVFSPASQATIAVEFPAEHLVAGVNQLNLTSQHEGWLIYDAVTLEARAGVDVVPVSDRTFLASAAVGVAPVARPDGTFTRLTATLVHTGEPADASIRFDGQELHAGRLARGRQTFEWLVPATKQARSAELSVVVRGERRAHRALLLTPGVREVVVVFKTHFDIGYTDMAAAVVQKYRTTMIDSALEVVEQNRDLPAAQQFVWTVPGWPMKKILEDWPGQTPERSRRVTQAVREGRFAVHALAFTTQTESLELEDLVRSLGYASRVTRELGLALPRAAKMTDVPEHIRSLPTLLARAGVEFMHIGCNPMSRVIEVPPVFWWQGPDGSRVLTMYSRYYGTQLMPDPEWPYRTWLALIHTSDNVGPPRPAEIKQVLDEAAAKLPGVKVRIGRLEDFGDALRTEGAEFPVVAADTPDTWIHGIMCDPDGASIARRTRPMLPATEALNTQLRAWGVKVPDATLAITEAYEQSLLYGEHTWGASTTWARTAGLFGEAFQREHVAGRFRRIEDSWDEHTTYIKATRDRIAPVLQANLQALAMGVAVTGARVVVFNPLPWSRAGTVSADWPGETPVALSPSEGGAAIPVERNGQSVRFFAGEIPPFGYRTFVPATVTAMPAAAEDRLDQATATMANRFFQATFDPARGTLRSLVDRRTGRELVDASAEIGFGQYLYERFDRGQVEAFCGSYLKPSWPSTAADFYKRGMPPPEQQPYRAASPRDFRLRFAESPVELTATLEAGPSNDARCAVTTRLILPRHEPWAELEITLHNKPADPWPEAGWLCLPFKIDAPRFQLGRLGTIVDPAREILTGANRHLLTLNSGLTITDSQGRGIGLCPLDQAVVSLDTPGMWKYSDDFVPRKPVVYLNLFNNQWNTNYRLWNSGTWTYRVRIWALDRADAEPALITPSAEARYPMLAAAVAGNAGALPVRREGLRLARRGILVTAFGANPDGDGTILRLWEHAGRAGPCEVRLPEGFAATTVQPLDLRGRPAGAPIPKRNETFTFDVRAFAPLTVRLETAGLRNQ